MQSIVCQLSLAKQALLTPSSRALRLGLRGNIGCPTGQAVSLMRGLYINRLVGNVAINRKVA